MRQGYWAPFAGSARAIRWSGLALAALLLALGCNTTAPAPVAEAAPEPTTPTEGFQASRAMGHLRGLLEIGPRVLGTEGVEAARAYVRRHLEILGLETEDASGEVGFDDGTSATLTNLTTLIAGSGPEGGEGRGEFVLATPLDTAPTETFELLGANEGASGVALLLEMARVLDQEPLPYPVRLLFLDGEVFEPERSMGAELAWSGLARSDVRLLVYVHQVGDADLAIHRDLLSQRALRDIFFRAAERLGHGDAFPRSAAFDQVPGGHSVFFNAGLRRIVALSDIRYGGDEPPGDYWRTADDDLGHVSEESLGVVGAVVLAGLRDAAVRMERVDVYVPRPPAPEEAPAEPEPEADSMLEEGDEPSGETAQPEPQMEQDDESEADPAPDEAPTADSESD